jgi:acetylornithine deacetylase/succinyl-diaminopimelate desuccinylase-like protein
MKSAYTLLQEFVAIPSVSADPVYRAHIDQAVVFIERELQQLGARTWIVSHEGCPPLVLGYLDAGKGETLAVYGHYDVQPDDPVDQWNSPPYELTKRDGKLYGRGVADNKGHIIQHLSVLRRLVAARRLSRNILCLYEGEEEVGSRYFERLVQSVHKDTSHPLRTVFRSLSGVLITDVGMHRRHAPQILTGLRGLVYFELEITCGERDLHSGIYGNVVYNPIDVASHLLHSMRALNGQVSIPGFYDDVTLPTKEDLRLLDDAKDDDEIIRREARTYVLPGSLAINDMLVSPSLASKICPSLDWNGIVSGYGGEGAKTVIPARAKLKFSTRLVPRQNPDRIADLIEEHIAKHIPREIQWNISVLSAAHPFVTDTSSPFFYLVQKALATEFHHKVLINRSGGSIPAAEILHRLLKVPIILTGFTLPDDNIHSPNENFDEELFIRGQRVLESIFTS